jgi:hypothetical protein
MPGCLLGLVEYVLCAVDVLGPAAGDQRASPRRARAGEQQRRAEMLLDLGGGGEVALGSFRSKAGVSVLKSGTAESDEHGHWRALTRALPHRVA